MDAVADERLELVCSAAPLTELGRVLSRPRIADRVSADDAALLGTLYAESALFFAAGPNPQRCRDPRDDYLLALADASEADYLVTRDDDLLVLQRHGHAEIVYPARFLQLLAATTRE